ncbi:PepSY-associated TM helix domain-containing protein [Pseudoduganella sp. GCM10020061]|uniref:PepSY-associated TM helix domain-containing protein n=1 Tax=Pseudoduganella sp. GCM10020061 TaxID=3317345 RepID=UPI00363BFD0D
MKKLGRTLHLWLGLVCGSVFVILGLTGSVIAWLPELDRMLNPELLQAPVQQGARMGDPLRVTPSAVQAVFDRLEADPAYGRPSQLAFPSFAGDVYVATYRVPQGKSPFELAVSRQVMLDPATLAVLGERNWGETGLSRPLLMPTLFHLHRYMVAGEAGKTVVGACGIVMVILALTGLILWWPRPTWTSIKAALTVRFGGSWPKLNYSLHRAAGFFLAPALLVQGFSGSYMNLPAVIAPAVNVVAPVSSTAKLKNRDPGAGLALDVHAALERAQAVFPDARTSRIVIPKPGVPYEIRVRQEGEIRHDDGATRITIDSASGQVLRVVDPLAGPRGDVLLSWMFPLHTGDAFGIAGRIFITLFGLTPLAFMVTGVAVWLKQRRSKHVVRNRMAAAAAAAAA